ncbi:hypothetical protein Q8A67_014780 [Cirrhinus molitorella]|uniref:Uncharacterized protein n=1 Tax=Cirrhinus molitorella TaxID=172907 RepID=A0AA88TK28_9TELE|nr:hypothetical protein Q8A67_014780 [Cirrhinus molitorella]
MVKTYVLREPVRDLKKFAALRLNRDERESSEKVPRVWYRTGSQKLTEVSRRGERRCRDTVQISGAQSV